jgi:hypothetical protein
LRYELARAPDGGHGRGAPAPNVKVAAPSDIFGAPAFAAGRAFSSTTLDALLCEMHFAPHVLFVVKLLVRASRKQRLQLLPIADAIAMGMLSAPSPVTAPPPPAPPPPPLHGFAASSAGGNRGGGATTLDEWGFEGRAAPTLALSEDSIVAVAVSALAAEAPRVPVTGATASLMSGAASAPLPLASLTLPEIRTYGQLFEALLRGWQLLPLGLYRRMQPGSVPAPPVVGDPAAQFVAGFARSAHGPGGAPMFRNEKGLVSYVSRRTLRRLAARHPPPPHHLLTHARTRARTHTHPHAAGFHQSTARHGAEPQ